MLNLSIKPVVINTALGDDIISLQNSLQSYQSAITMHDTIQSATPGSLHSQPILYAPIPSLEKYSNSDRIEELVKKASNNLLDNEKYDRNCLIVLPYGQSNRVMEIYDKIIHASLDEALPIFDGIMVGDDSVLKSISKYFKGDYSIGDKDAEADLLLFSCDSLINNITFTELQNQKLLANNHFQSGIIPGEAAVFLYAKHSENNAIYYASNIPNNINELSDQINTLMAAANINHIKYCYSNLRQCSEDISLFNNLKQSLKFLDIEHINITQGLGNIGSNAILLLLTMATNCYDKDNDCNMILHKNCNNLIDIIITNQKEVGNAKHCSK